MRAPVSDRMSLAGRLAAELGPVFLFFALVQWQGIFIGTAAFMAAVASVAVLSWRQERRVPVLPLIALAFALLFGGATLLLHDPVWIVMRPTIYNLAAAAALAAAAWRGWLILKSVFGSGIGLADDVWRRLTWRLVAFFLLLAVLNEIVWRAFGIDAWVGFKAFAVPALNLAFLAVNWRYAERERRDEARTVPVGAGA